MRTLRPNAFWRQLAGAGLLALAVAFLPSPPNAVAAGATTFSFTSQFGWSVYSTDGTFLGPAQEVCLNTTLPGPRCRTGAMAYGYVGEGWPADLSSIAPAQWIWIPGVTGETTIDLQAFAFSRTFHLPGAPISGTISIAADDFAEVFVNGVSVGTIGSIHDQSLAGAAQESLTTFDLSPYLVAGENVITVVAQNGPYVICPEECSYADNPTGVVFGGSLSAVVPD
jgi:hypothetical protein